MTHRPHLFLDIDGVLHPNLPAPGQRMGKVPLLAKALLGREVRVVISPGWRFHHDLEAYCEIFPKDLRARAVGNTGDAHLGRHARWHEITTYVRLHGLKGAN